MAGPAQIAPIATIPVGFRDGDLSLVGMGLGSGQLRSLLTARGGSGAPLVGAAPLGATARASAATLCMDSYAAQWADPWAESEAKRSLDLESTSGT